MKIGDWVYTPRFCSVKIKAIFDNVSEAYKEGYNEPTYYDNPDYSILGKHTGTNRMAFAGVKNN